jgi:chromosome segregation ATPase
MGKLTRRLVLVALALVPTSAGAQSAAAGHGVPHDDAAAEIARLRQTVEKLAVVVVQSQVLAARLAAQQQRVLSEQDAVARAEEAIDAAARRQERMRATLDRSSRALVDVVEDPRTELRREVENLKADLDDQDRELTSLRARLAQAEESLRNEERSYTDLDAALKGLVSDVERLNR